MLYLAHRPISLCEIGFQEGIKQVACQALNCIIYWQDMNALAVLDICALQPKVVLVQTVSTSDTLGVDLKQIRQLRNR